MKMDIVNPIPPSIPAPSILVHFRSLGNEHIPAVTARNENSQIPNGFPTTRPNIIPIVLG